MATNGNTLSKSGIKGNKWHLFKTYWFNKSAISKLPHSSIKHFEKTGLYEKLPSIGSHGIVGGGHNPFMGPGIRFEPGAKPCFIPAKK